MVVKKFYGATTRDALRQVRDELGPDALILSNRQVAGGGVEIMAVADADVAALTSVQTVSASPRATARAAQNGARLMRSAQDEPTPAPAPAPINRALARSYAIPDEDSEPTLDDLPSDVIPVGMRSNRGTPQRAPESWSDQSNQFATPQQPSAPQQPEPSREAPTPYNPTQSAARPAPAPSFSPRPAPTPPTPVVASRPAPRRETPRPASNFRYEEEAQASASNGVG